MKSYEMTRCCVGLGPRQKQALQGLTPGRDSRGYLDSTRTYLFISSYVCSYTNFSKRPLSESLAQYVSANTFPSLRV